MAAPILFFSIRLFRMLIQVDAVIHLEVLQVVLLDEVVITGWIGRWIANQNARLR